MRFAAEVPGLGPVGRRQVPLVDGERLIPAIDHEPVNRIGFHNPANLTLKLFQCAHVQKTVLSQSQKIIASRFDQILIAMY